MWEMKRMEKSTLSFLFFKIFIWLPWVLTAACRILIFTEACRTLLQHAGSSSLTKDGTRPPALGVSSLSRWTSRGVPSTLILH